MPAFQVTSISPPSAIPPKKRARRLPYQWYVVTRALIGGTIGGLLFTLLLNIFGHPDTFFILLPVFVSLTWAQPLRYNIGKFLSSTPIYLLLTICWTFIYYGAITESQVLLYRNPTVSHIIIVASSISWVIMLDPVRAYIQQHIERRFNLRDRKTVNAIEAFTSTLREEIDLDQLRERFLTIIQQTMRPYSLSLWIHTPDGQLGEAGSLTEISIASDDPLVAYMLRHSRVLEVDHLQLDSPLLRDLKLRAADILLPLASQGELVGLLILGTHLKGERYTRDELALLSTLAIQVAPAVRVGLLVQEQKKQVRERERIEQVRVREHERIEQELQTARSIQQSFLPGDVPALAGWQFAPYYQPAREVGGDFYDFLPFADGRLGIVIGDVTGKGIPAALLMATVHTMLRTAVQGMISPGEVLARVNELLVAEIPEGMFVTCFFALLDPESGHLHYANAGHEPPYHQHGGNAAELWATGMPLGMLPGTRYEEYEITLSPGDSLLFYSDGLVEAHNPAKDMFGFPRLQKVLTEQTNGTPLIDVLLSELQRFTGEEWEQEDDVTLLTLQRTSETFSFQNA
ncbi:MAG TPA: GAF domain-containing SpoIIE family protein phosphatase [Ktedonobacteraceae bacterium]|nr:GAF domain-containing SpoIIE family protein phosphatase [Ktedonobacteraceae bacterium]